MNSLATVQTKAVRAINRGALVVKKHSPEILLGLGLTGIVVAAVMAAKATLKAPAIVEGVKENLKTIDEGDAAPEEKQQAVGLTYIYAGLDFAKLYGPSVGIGVLSIASILSSHGIMKRREVGLIAGYNLLAEGFAAYRKRVVEELGPDVDRNYRLGIYESSTNEKVVNEDGTVTKQKVKVMTVKDKTTSGFAKFFDEYSTQWQKSAETNLYFLRIQQNHVNDMLRARGHVFLNEVYDMLGLPRTKEGSIYGWVMNGDGTTVIDFGIYNIENPAGRAFVNGYEKAILLDFNVTGIIWDLIEG
jgi:hypothetical protein